MRVEIDGFPADEPTLDLDHRRFSYAGKFVMSNSGKATVRDDGRVLAAASFNADRTDERTVWIRYLTVRDDRRGESIGARLALVLRQRLLTLDYRRVRVAVNNPFAFHAMHRAGFGYTGETTGIAELVCSSDADPSRRYDEGLRQFGTRSDLALSERQFIEEHAGEDPPDQIATNEEGV